MSCIHITVALDAKSDKSQGGGRMLKREKVTGIESWEWGKNLVFM